MPTTQTDRQIAQLLQDPHLFGTSLLTLVLDIYGTEALDWTFETLLMELQDDYGAEIPPINRDKLNAILVCLTTDQFYRDAMFFNYASQALSNDAVDFSHLDLCDPEDMGWAISEILALDGQGRPQFTPDVCRFVGTILSMYGIYHPPDVLKIADYPPGALENTNTNISSDPALYAAFYQRSRSDAQDIVDEIKSRFEELIQQLDTLPLRHRDQRSWDKLKDNIQRQ